MLKRLNKALIKASSDKVYNIVLILMVVLIGLSLVFDSSFLFIAGIFFACVDIGLIYRFYLLEKLDENNK